MGKASLAREAIEASTADSRPCRMGYVLAWRRRPGLRDQAQVKLGEKVLVIGRVGWRGYLRRADRQGRRCRGHRRVQYAQVDMVRSIGADHVIDYTRDGVTGGEQRYDAILDIGGSRRLSHLRRALTPGGRLVITGGETGGRWIGGYDPGFRAQLLSLFVDQELGGFMASENSADLIVLRELPHAANKRSATAMCRTGVIRRAATMRCRARLRPPARSRPRVQPSPLHGPRLC